MMLPASHPCLSSNGASSVPLLLRGLLPLRSVHRRIPPRAVPRRGGLVVCRSSTAENEPQQQQGESKDGGSLFGGEKQLSGPQKLVRALPVPARYAACAALVAGALASGYSLGSTAKGTRVAAVGGAVALGAAGSVAAYVLHSSAPAIAAVQLHNAMVNLKDPKSISREEVDSIIQMYGVSKQDEALTTELRDLYERFVTGIIPPGNEDLKGDEVESIIVFKNALGLEDPDAAAVHIEIGRRIFRQRLETGDKETAVQERRTFQKLVYVSNLVFGDASKFLLPWKRVFKVTDSQIEVAMRDNAQRLFQAKLDTIGQDVDAQQLMELRDYQLKIRLSDEIASDMVRAHARKQIESHLLTAIEILKSRARMKNTKKMIDEMEWVLKYNSSLAAVSAESDSKRLPPGIGSVSVLGGQFDDDRKMDDLAQLYRAYLTEALSWGRLEDEKVGALNQLKNIFAMGNREAEDIMQDVTMKVYRKRLAQAAAPGGELDQATSKASYLQKLCDILHFDPEKAKEVHEDIYRQKLQQCLADGSLSDADVKGLRRLRVMLCLHQDVVDAAHATICGRLFEKVVDDAIAAGVDGYDADMKAAVRNGVTGLRLTTEAALAIASKAVRAILITYVKRSRSAGSRVESARELKKLVIFNNLVVTELISDIKGEPASAETPPKIEAAAESESKVEDDEEEWESLQTLRKTKPKSDLDMGRPPQSEITLKDDLELRERTDLYRTYLLYCVSGETSGMPLGTQITVQKDNSEFVRLGQLGTLLGLSPREVADVHKGLAEQAFRQQAQVILADGQLSKARMEQLNQLQTQLGLPSESAQKVIKSITNTRMQGAIESAISQGKLTIEQIRELKEAGVNIESMIPSGTRNKLYKKIIDEVFSSGTGEFDEEEIYGKIPSDLGLELNNSKAMVEEIAKQRLKSSLVQAVSLLRQKNPEGAVSSVNDMLACDKAVAAEEPLSWAVEDELADLFCFFYKSSTDSAKIERVQYLLGIDDRAASTLKEMIDAGKFAVGEEEEFSF